MNTRGKITIGILVIGFLVLLVPAFVMAQQTVKVKCEKGQSVQSALDSLTGPATITVTGTCRENVVIKNDDVILEGGTYEASDPTHTTIMVEGARRVAIKSVTVKGGLSGVAAYQGGSLTLENSLIKENPGRGVVSLYGSSVTVNSSRIQDNTILGVSVTDNSALILTNSIITGNHGPGVVVQRASSARIGRDIFGVAGLNEITNNEGVGVSVLQSAYAQIDGNTITSNSGDGVSIQGASATVVNNTVAYNKKGISVIGSGSARIGLNDGSQAGPNTIENNSSDGIHCANGGAVYIFSNTIQNNGLTTKRMGVLIDHATGELIGDNTIQGNGGHGVAVNQGALLQGVGDWNLTPGPDLITENGRSGISAWNTASLNIRHVTVTNNAENGIVLSLRSALRIYDATVSDNQLNGIVLYDGSWVARYSTDSPRDSITGNTGWGIICYGGNLIGVTSGIDGNTAGEVNCPPIVIPTP